MCLEVFFVESNDNLLNQRKLKLSPLNKWYICMYNIYESLRCFHPLSLRCTYFVKKFIIYLEIHVVKSNEIVLLVNKYQCLHISKRLGHFGKDQPLTL
jgi:hypothetical protein